MITLRVHTARQSVRVITLRVHTARQSVRVITLRLHTARQSVRVITLRVHTARQSVTLAWFTINKRGRRGRDGMVVGLTVTYAISAYHH